MVTKQCPKCEQQVPVACKACPCGHIYFQGRKLAISTSSDTSSGAVNAVRQRRTERLRQVRVNRESLHSFTKVHKSSRPQRSIRPTITNTKPKAEKESNTDGLPRKRRGRQKRNSSADREIETVQEEDAFANIPPEKAMRYSIVLAEINRKIGCNSIHF